MAPRRNPAIPANTEAEAGLLGAMILPGRDELRSALLAQLSAADFHRPAHGHVFEAIRELHQSGAEEITVPLLAEQLGLRGLLDAVGGAPALVSLQVAAATASTARRYAVVVAELATKRRSLALVEELRVAMQDGDTATADRVRAELDALALQPGSARSSAGPLHSASERLGAFVERLSDPAAAEAVSTGAPSLDRLLAGGWHEGLYLLGGLPGVGKSAFALQAAINAAGDGNGTPVLYVTVEQSEDDLMGRIFCRELQAPIGAYWARDRHYVNGVRRVAADLPLDNLFLRSDPYIAGADDLGTAGRVRRWAEQLIARSQRRPLIVVDYLQRMRPPEADRRLDERLRISMAGFTLRQMVRDLGVPVLVVSSIGRANYDGPPSLGWFKGSGDLEYDADAAIILRPSVDELEASVRFPVELHLLKSRFGELTSPTSPVMLVFDRRFGSFAEIQKLSKAAGGSEPAAPPRPPRLRPLPGLAD